MSIRLRSSIKRTLLLAAAGAFSSGVALAQTPANPLVEEIEVVVITGSYIDGTAQNAGLPVQVITADDLEKQGSPSMIELVKSIPSNQGIVGEANQFVSPQNTGISQVNLRGLGPLRTLVLLNGKRLAFAPSQGVAGGVGVDTNLIPPAAIGRIEVLKDGASATYGSDAVGGVVNFITRKGVDGLSIDGSYSYLNGSDGDYSTDLVWGNTGETYDFLVTAGYRHRSELQTTDRDFALRSFTDNPQGGYSSITAPGVYTLLNASRTAPVGVFRDPACATLGGVPTGAGFTVGCQNQFTQFQNLVEREEHYNIYSEFNKALGGTNLHVEAFYAAHDVPEENSTPAYPVIQGARGGAPNFFIPLTNPGLAALLPSLTMPQQAAITAAGGTLLSGLQAGLLGLGGNPLTGEGKKDSRFFDGFRVATALDGELSSVKWNIGLTFSENRRDADTPDILVYRLDRALRGVGGTNCASGVAGDTANGCYFFNPFSTGIAMNPIGGQVNPALGQGGTYVASTANSQNVVQSLFGNFGFNDTSTLTAVDALFNGETGLKLPGGQIAWAAGAQYREETFKRDISDDANTDINPCPDTPVNGNTSCAVKSGPLAFLGTISESLFDVHQGVASVFGELSLPVTDSVQAQLAYRYEDYNGVGSTSNPKLSVRWQATDWMGLRASYGSAFRAPLGAQLVPGSLTFLLFTPLANGAQNLSAFRPYDTFGNPDLDPETAKTLNAGVFFNVAGFSASLDYYNVKLSDPIGSEPGPDIVREFFGTTTAPANHCGQAAYAGLQSRLTFTGACAPQNLLRTHVNAFNGPDEETSGVDVSAKYTFNNVLRGDLTLGTDFTYMIEYKRDQLFIEGIAIQGQGGRDFAGTRGQFNPLPDLKGQVYLDWGSDRQNVRLTTRYVAGVTDLRASVADPVTGELFKQGSFLTYDLVYRLSLPSQTTVTASVVNLTDRDPPFSRVEYSYDPFTANPFGRVVKVAATKRF